MFSSNFSTKRVNASLDTHGYNYLVDNRPMKQNFIEEYGKNISLTTLQE